MRATRRVGKDLYYILCMFSQRCNSATLQRDGRRHTTRRLGSALRVGASPYTLAPYLYTFSRQWTLSTLWAPCEVRYKGFVGCLVYWQFMVTRCVRINDKVQHRQCMAVFRTALYSCHVHSTLQYCMVDFQVGRRGLLPTQHSKHTQSLFHNG